MEYVQAKKATDIKLDGITVTFDKVDTTLNAVYLKDAAGNHCRIMLQSYSMQAQVPAPPKKEKRHVVRGEVPSLGKVRKEFAEKYEAEKAKRDLERMTGETFSLDCEEVEVRDEAPVSDEIPF